MPRQHRPKQVADCQASLTALTIHDYANNTNPKNRLRKVHQPTKNLDAQEQTQRSDGDLAAINDDHLNDVDELTEHQQRGIRRGRRSRTKPTANGDDVGHQYAYHHEDVWFAIARHVAAEDVGRFACINRQTAHVTRTATFWTHLYRRECSDRAVTTVTGMPQRLRPDCMVRLGGLRTCTIRALFYCNETLRSRLRNPAVAPSVFDLVRRECVGAWTVAASEAEAKGGSSWWHCYRLKRRLPVGSRLAESDAVRKRNVFERVYRDIYHNADESCALLAVRMPTVRPLPQLFGEQCYVGEVRHNLSGRGCAEYRLAVTFVSGAARGDVLAHVVYDPVAEVRVLEWWTPDYHAFVARGAAES